MGQRPVLQVGMHLLDDRVTAVLGLGLQLAIGLSVKQA